MRIDKIYTKGENWILPPPPKIGKFQILWYQSSSIFHAEKMDVVIKISLNGDQDKND